MDISPTKIKKNKRQAAHCLVSKDFEQCTNLCQTALRELQSHLKYDRHSEDAEHFVVIVSQALAEQDRWQEVLPYVTDVYDGIENCPPNILKLCLLLHAKVQEYGTCSAIYSIWCRSNDRFCSAEDKIMLMDVYVRQVLIPLEKHGEIAGFVSAVGIDDSTQLTYIQTYTKLISKIEAEKLLSEKQQKQQQADPTITSVVKDPQGIMDEIVKKLLKTIQVFAKWSWTQAPKTAVKVVLAISLILAALLTVNTLDLNSGSNHMYLTALLQSFISKVKLSR